MVPATNPPTAGPQLEPPAWAGAAKAAASASAAAAAATLLSGLVMVIPLVFSIGPAFALHVVRRHQAARGSRPVNRAIALANAAWIGDNSLQQGTKGGKPCVVSFSDWRSVWPCRRRWPGRMNRSCCARAWRSEATGHTERER